MTRRWVYWTIPVMLTVLVPFLRAGEDPSEPLNEAILTLLRSQTVDERLSYTGTLVAEIRSPFVRFEREMRLVHDHKEPSNDVREVLHVRVNGEEAVPGSVEGVEEFWARRPITGTQGPAGPSVPPSSSVGPGYPPMHTFRMFRIRDVELLLRNYEVRQVPSVTVVGRPCLAFEVTPRRTGLPSYLIHVDEETGLVLRSVTRFPEDDEFWVSHAFADIEFGSSVPVMAASGPPIPTVPELSRLAPEVARARDAVPGFALPVTLPEGFRSASLDVTESTEGERIVVLEFTNGVETYFAIVRPPMADAADPVEVGLDRLARDMGLDTLPPEARREILDLYRDRLAQVAETIHRWKAKVAGEEEEGRSAIAWTRSRLGITRATVFTAKLDLLLVGPVGTDALVLTAESILNGR
jgi:hypothetical protein